MDRRAFLEAVVGAMALTGCIVDPLAANDDAERPGPDLDGADGATPDARSSDPEPLDPETADGAPVFPLHPDASLAGDGPDGLWLPTFRVTLGDTRCSHHQHQAAVVEGYYDPEGEVPFLGGSHLVVFTVEELRRLLDGEILPYATSGDFAGHGHCGTAWHADLEGTLDQARREQFDACDLPADLSAHCV